MAPKLASTARNWFEQGGKQYAQFRPEYPPELAAFLATVSPSMDIAVDVGCGNGQLTGQLAEHFGEVVGIDPSADQLANATPRKNISFICASAESLPLANHQASLVVAAQAAHWFDLPRFYDEVRRIGAPDATLALVSYGVLSLDEQLNSRFEDFYWREIGPYWPAERKLVDSGYAGLAFPFKEQQAPPIAIKKTWTLAQLLGYIGTWSAVIRLREAGHFNILETFAVDLGTLWGNPEDCRDISWPINMRIGQLPG